MRTLHSKGSRNVLVRINQCIRFQIEMQCVFGVPEIYPFESLH